MVKIACLGDAFLEVFLTASELSRRLMGAAKRNSKEKKERQKKISKIEKPKDVGLKINFCFLHTPESKMCVVKRNVSGKKSKL